MDLKLQTSFIPKKMSADSRIRKTPMGLFTIAGWFLFIVAVLAAGGLFAFNYVTAQSIESKRAELETKAQSFPASDVQDLVRLSNRIETAKTILQGHLTLSKLFELISAQTIQSVQFTGFNYAATGNKLSVILTGKAPDFSSVALQSDTFSRLSYLKDQIFSDLTLGPDNKSVMFKFTAAVDPSAIQYTVGTASASSTQPTKP